MRITRERFEHELVKIKSQVGPEFVGLCGRLSDENGRHCIIGQMLANFGFSDRDMSAGYLQCFMGTETERLAKQAITMNDLGDTWHEIVDRLVPKTADVRIEQEAEALV